MKILMTLIISIISFQACILKDKNFDIIEARKFVYLDSNELNYFSILHQQIINDTIQIRKLYEKVSDPRAQSTWTSTNSYYLDQIDSSKYRMLFYKLKGKLLNDIRINKDGSVIFTVKQSVQMNFGDYNETYSHQLVSTNCNCPIETVFNHVDSVFIDSTINNSWRYTAYKVLTGH